MNGLRAEKLQPKRTSEFTETIQNSIQKERSKLYKRNREDRKHKVRLINIPEEKRIGHNPQLVLESWF